MTSRDRLSGQTEDRRIARVGSSPAPSTRSERTRLWKQLRGLDRQIAEADNWLYYNSWLLRYGPEIRKVEDRRDRLDKKRKDVRMRLKWRNSSKSNGRD